MEFIFDIKKAVSSAGFLCQLSGGSIGVRELLKMLYLAEREAITTWHRSITGDQIFSMPQGMVMSRVYDLIRCRVSGSDMAEWKKVFTPRMGHLIKICDANALNLDSLSEREENALRNGFETIRILQAEHGEEYVEVLHKMLPEWQNPNGSSVLVQPEKILLLEGEEQDCIESISAELAAINSAKLALQAD